MKGGQIPMLGGSSCNNGYSKKGGQIVSLGGGKNKRMRGGSFAEVGAGASGQLTAGNGMGVTGAGEIATGAKLGPIAAHAGVSGQAGASVGNEGMVVTQNGGRRRHRKRSSAKRSSAKRSSSKRRGTTKRRSAKRSSAKRKSRKH